MNRISFIVSVVTIVVMAPILRAQSDCAPVPGRSPLWCPSTNLLLYAVEGKSSDSRTWRVLDPVTGDEDTVFFGRNIAPSWSSDGKNIAWQKDGTICVLSRNGVKTEISTPLAAVESLSWFPDGNRLLYAGDGRIMLYDFEKKKNSSIASGRRPTALAGGAGLVYADDDYHLNAINAAGASEALVEQVDEFVLSGDRSVLAALQSSPIRFVLMDMSTRATSFYTPPGNVSGFCLDRTGRRLYYGLIGKGVVMVDRFTGQEKTVSADGLFPSVSADAGFLFYERADGSGCVVKLGRERSSVQLVRISLGSKDNALPGEVVRFFEEKVNPVSGEVTGYDGSRPKGQGKILMVFGGYSFVEMDKPGRIEVGDAVVSSGRETTAAVLGLEE